MLQSRANTSPRPQALVLGMTSLIAYLLTRTRDLGGDDTVFAMAVDSFVSGHGVAGELAHPHHPLYNLLVSALLWLLRAFGFNPLVSDVGAALSACFAAAVVAGLALILAKAGIPDGVAILAAAVAGTCGGFWHFATCMEVYTLGAAAVLAWLWVVGREQPDGAATGASVALATVAHLVLGLLLLPSLVRLRQRPREALRATVTALGLAALVVAANLSLFHHAHTPAAWLRTITPGYGAYLVTPKPLAALSAMHDLAVWGWYREVPLFAQNVVRAFDGAGAIATAVLVLLMLAGVVAAVRLRPPLAVTSALALAAFVLLWLVWDVGNVEHVVAATPLFAVLVAYGAQELAPRGGTLALAGVLGVFLVSNGLGSAVPQARQENSRTCVVASFVSESTPVDAVVISVGTDARVRLALPYLSGRRVVDLTLAVASARRQRQPATVALAYWSDVARSAKHLYALPDVFAPSSLAWVERIGLPTDRFAAVVAGFHVVRRHELPADGVVLDAPFVLREISTR
jgi:hypothetical protein